ncbi:MAG: hypothetical protein NC217_08845 [Muribaculaceae bacterium]|nr:hypothetical protein [Muribaculaceae bacterium]
MAQGRKTGGRQKGTPNKPNPLKEQLRANSMAYFEPNITLDDEEVAAAVHMPLGSVVSRFDLDMAMMEPKDRATIQEKLLRYHTPQMQSVSAEVSLSDDTTATIAERLANLATANDN